MLSNLPPNLPDSPDLPSDLPLQPQIPPAQAAQSWQGCLRLAFEPRSDRTLLSQVQVQAPLKVQRPFYPEGDVCHTVMLHTAGGIVGGDRLEITARLQPQAQVLLTTAAATKVYRSNGLEAQQTTDLRLAAGACLEWLPQETILFNGAQFRQKLRVDLAADATWLGWEITRLGRSARGERFETGHWRSQIEVWQDQRLVWVDPQWVEGGGEMLTSLHGLAGAVVVGSFALIGPSLMVQPAHCLDMARDLLPTPAFSVTQLQTGLLCRYRGDSTAAARRGFTAVWQALRSNWGRGHCIPRVW
ncbi:MAG: urease accessory protein UreD [Elainella sp.]